MCEAWLCHRYNGYLCWWWSSILQRREMCFMQATQFLERRRKAVWEVSWWFLLQQHGWKVCGLWRRVQIWPCSVHLCEIRCFPIHPWMPTFCTFPTRRSMYCMLPPQVLELWYCYMWIVWRRFLQHFWEEVCGLLGRLQVWYDLISVCEDWCVPGCSCLSSCSTFLRWYTMCCMLPSQILEPWHI